MNFKERLQRCMDYRQISQIELARRTEISRSSICLYLKGERIPKTEQIGRIAMALDVAPSYLLGLDNSMTVSVIQPLNHLAPNPEMDMKEELIKEITAMLTWESVENLRTILPVVKALCKGNK